jgi:hypothetical protein
MAPAFVEYFTSMTASPFVHLFAGFTDVAAIASRTEKDINDVARLAIQFSLDCKHFTIFHLY